MKENATFLNTARTQIADIKALIEKAEKNKNFKVGLDIDIEENRKILTKRRNNVIVTPHIAGVTIQSMQRMDKEVANTIVKKKNVLEKV